MAENSILIDMTRCTGCRACQVACKEWNRLDRDPRVGNLQGYESHPSLSGETWTLLRFIERSWPGHASQPGAAPTVLWEFLKTQCMHCAEAPCLDSCPAGAIGHTSEGYVFILEERCTGCGACVQACPYAAVHLNHRGVARKCTFCLDRVGVGLAPACAQACGLGALLYGDREVLLEDAKVRVDALRAGPFPDANLYGANELGGLQMIYVLPYAPAAYGLPAAPARPVNRWLGSWLGGTAAAVALVALPFWWVSRRRSQLEGEVKGN